MIVAYLGWRVTLTQRSAAEDLLNPRPEWAERPRGEVRLGRAAGSRTTGSERRVDDRQLSALAVSVQRGDRRSFKKLVDALTRTLIAMAYRYTHDWEWARDLTQETWIKVYQRIQGYDPERSFRSWLYAVHRNGCLTHLRKSWVRLEQSAQGELIGDGRPTASRDNPEEEVMRREFHRQLIAALGTLGESQRQVFVRVDLEGNDQKEVARALGMKHSTLRTTLHFARKRLASVLREVEGAA